MGSGIAHVCALAGIPVVLNDIASQRMKDALATIDRMLGHIGTAARLTAGLTQRPLQKAIAAAVERAIERDDRRRGRGSGSEVA